MVWNETVANLTLMALGSSAPEIMLATIEIIARNFEAGDLGPGTIIGSAAFNLLMITAICNVAIPEPNGEGETGVRKIKEFGVFCITASASLLAYIWMWMALDVITPNQIDIWEGVLTLACFPLLIIIAWCHDRKWFGWFGKESPKKEQYKDD